VYIFTGLNDRIDLSFFSRFEKFFGLLPKKKPSPQVFFLIAGPGPGGHAERVRIQQRANSAVDVAHLEAARHGHAHRRALERQRYGHARIRR